jgi:hypothetical protein
MQLLQVVFYTHLKSPHWKMAGRGHLYPDWEARQWMCYHKVILCSSVLHAAFILMRRMGLRTALLWDRVKRVITVLRHYVWVLLCTFSKIVDWERRFETLVIILLTPTYSNWLDLWGYIRQMATPNVKPSFSFDCFSLVFLVMKWHHLEMHQDLRVSGLVSKKRTMT